MKWFKRFVYILCVIALAAAGVYVFFVWGRHKIKCRFSEAKAYYDNGDMRRASSALKDLYGRVRDTEMKACALYLLSKAYINLNETDKAEKYLNMLMDMGTEQYGAECLFALSGIQMQTGRADAAVKNYKRIITEYPESNLADDALFNLAGADKENGRLKEAREKLEHIIETYPGSNLINACEEEIGNINIGILFSPAIADGSTEYIVQKGDMLYKIAAKFGTTVELIKRCNNIKSNFIKPGDRLKIVTEKFSIVVDKSKNILTLKEGEEVLKVYPVGTGRKGSTPAGVYTIANKLVDPPWYKPGKGVVPYGDPDNVLGTRWMGFNNPGYGIHGTWEPDTIGRQASAGCIRMLNKDVEELFDIVPAGTEVTIVE